MRKNERAGAALIFWALSLFSHADETPLWNFGGYVTESPRTQKIGHSWWTDNLIHGRFNNAFHFSEDWRGVLDLRSRLFTGDTPGRFPQFTEVLEWNPNFWDLSQVSLRDGNTVWQNETDRLWVEKSFGEVELRLGRQRINWGQNFVWNPNDLFNTYSYLDFDHEEKPGADALRFTWHTGPMSQVELAHKWAARPEKNVSAVLWKFNRWDYDFQFLGGEFEGSPFWGAGFAGQIGWVGVRGESTCFDGTWVSALSADYTCENSFSIRMEALHNEQPFEASPQILPQEALLFSKMISPKRLSTSRYSAFLGLGYDLTPLVRADLSGIVSLSDHSFFWTPSFSYSLKTDWDLKLLADFFQGSADSEWGNGASLWVLQLKNSF